MVSTRGVKYKFTEGEKVLCYEPDPAKTKVLYDSKVLDIIVDKGENGKKLVQFLIHFQGWNPTWDRLVTEDYILKDTEENRLLQRQLAEKAQLTAGGYLYKRDRKKRPGSSTPSVGLGPVVKLTAPGAPGGGVGVERGPGPGSSGAVSTSDDSDLEPSPNLLPVSYKLKLLLEKDYELVTHLNKVVRLPANPNIVSILELYLQNYARSKLKSNSKKSSKAPPNQPELNPDVFIKNMNLCREIVDGLRIYIDFMLDKILLYQEEFNLLSATRSNDIEFPLQKIKEEPKGDEYDEEEVPAKKAYLSNSYKDGHDEHAEQAVDNYGDRKRTLRSHANCPVVELTQNGLGKPSPSYSTSSSCSLPQGQWEVDKEKELEDELMSKVLAWTLLPHHLRNEQPIKLSLLFGAPHLARAFVKLPELLQRSPHSEEKNNLIISFLNDLMKFLEEHPEWFEDSHYQENTFTSEASSKTGDK